MLKIRAFIKDRYKKIVPFVVAMTMVVGVGENIVLSGDYVDDFYIEYNGNIYKYRERVITVKVDESIVKTGDMPAVLVENTTMVPVREIFENASIGATVNWSSTKQEAYISYLDQFIVLKIGSTTAYVNNQPVELTVPAMLIKDMTKQQPKTMLPLRFVSENLGFDVNWDKETFTAEIATKKPNNGNQDNNENQGSQTQEPDSSTEVTHPTTTTPVVDADTNDDSKVVSGEQLDKLSGTKANRPLPTTLTTNPVAFTSSGNVTEGIEASYSETNIVAQKHYPVQIDEVNYVEKGEYRGFEIDATGSISEVSTHVWNGKFIIKIYNSSLDLKSNEIVYDNNDIVTSVRMGEDIAEDGRTFSSIVFDLKTSGYKFNLSISEDREKIYVDAVNNSIYKVELKQNTTGDYIDITGVNATNVKAFRLSNPSRIVFDIPNTKTLLGTQSSMAQGQYVTAIRTAQFEATTSRIVVETDGQPDYQILEVNDQTTRIQILEPTYENITYDNTTETPTIVIDKAETDTSLTLNNITYQDNYLKRESIITLPGDYTKYFGSGNVKINDAVIDNITFKLDAKGNTEVVIKSKTIREYRIEENENGLVIKAYKPTELYKRVVVIDPGHGGKDPGAVVGTNLEKNVNLGVTLELKKLLTSESNTKVYYTRLDDTYPTLEERCVLANEVEADIFVSLHCNSFVSTYKGTETLFLPGGNTPGLNAFELAKVFQDTFTANTKLENYKIKERDNLYVLNKTDMPAIILEMGFLTNDYDRSFLTDVNYHDDLAKGILASIQAVFTQYPTGR